MTVAERCPTQSGVYVFQLLEKVKVRAIPPDQRPGLAQRSLDQWLRDKQEALEVVNHMDLASGDPDKIRWAVDRVYQA